MRSIFKSWFKRKPKFYPKQVFAGPHGACNLLVMVGTEDYVPILRKLDDGEIIESDVSRRGFELYSKRVENLKEILEKPGIYLLETASTGGALNRLRFARMDVQRITSHE